MKWVNKHGAEYGQYTEYTGIHTLCSFTTTAKAKGLSGEASSSASNSDTKKLGGMSVGRV